MEKPSGRALCLAKLPEAINCEPRVVHFVKAKEFRRFRINGIDIGLELNEKIFPPSPCGLFFAENFSVNEGETVIDIGTGSGILGIVASKMSGIVSATDIDADAIAVARKNAQANHASIDFDNAAYFGRFKQKFDVIIANLPHEIVHDSYKQAIGAQLSSTIDGGRLGNEKILGLLDIVHKHMHDNSRLYLVVSTISDYASTIKKIISCYNTRLVAFGDAETKEFVEDNLEWYLQLNHKGVIKIFQQDGKWKLLEFLFELQIKNS